jgi:hypothetical protein
MSEFNQPDALEEYMGLPVERMTDLQLVSYIKLYMRVVHDLNLPVQGFPERSMMAWMRRTYHQDAPQIIKWVLWKHKGKPDGTPITYTWFSKGHKWRIDKVYLEMQQHRQHAPVKELKLAQDAFG